MKSKWQTPKEMMATLQDTREMMATLQDTREQSTDALDKHALEQARQLAQAAEALAARHRIIGANDSNAFAANFGADAGAPANRDRLLDNGGVAAVHEGIVCDATNESPLTGPR